MAEPVREPGFIEWLRIGWNWLALAGATAAVVLLALGMRPAAGPHAIATQESVEIDRIVSDVDFTLIANLDVLLAVDDNDLWLDPSLR